MEKPKRKIMKSPSRILPLCLLLRFVSTFHLQADPRHELPVTNENTLNDLVRTIPYLSYFREDQLSRLSAIQEQLVVFESRMRGEGLPEPLATAFSINYAAIQQSLVDDRITEDTAGICCRCTDSCWTGPTSGCVSRHPTRPFPMK